MKYYLAIDVGTHSVRAAIVDEQACIKQLHQRAITLTHPKPRYVEQDPIQILQACHDCIAELGDDLSSCTSAALVIQRSTVLAWQRKTGEALSVALSWQDTRAHSQISVLNPSQREIIFSRTGLRASAYYGASKIAILQHGLVPEAACTGPLASWLGGQLTCGPSQTEHFANVCDESNAARTLLFNLQTRQWDDTLCHIFNVDKAMLPSLCSVEHAYGKLYCPSQPALNLPLRVVCGDQNAAFACSQAMPIPHCPKYCATRNILVNMGTGAFVLAALPAQENKRISRCNASKRCYIPWFTVLLRNLAVRHVNIMHWRER